MAHALPPSLIALQISGDFGPLTIYTDRYGRAVAYPKSPPKTDPSPLQVVVRNSFKTAQANYMAETQQVRVDWETLVKRASLCQTGQNLYISISMLHNFDVLQTLIRQTGIFVAPPAAT